MTRTVNDLTSTLTRRRFAAVLGASAAAALLPLPLRAAGPGFVYVGMHGNQIKAARFDAATGELTLTGVAATVPSPTWMVMHPSLPIVYSDSELGNDGKTDGAVYAMHIDPATGMLTQLDSVDAGGGGTTYLYLDAPSMTILACNYGSGSVATIPIGDYGRLSPVSSVTKDVGKGPSPRQQSPHAHSVVIDPSGRYALVPDLGADRVFVYPFDRAARVLRPDPPGAERHYVAPPGSGPRHVAFHPSGRVAYLFTELTAQIQTLRWDAAAGRLTLLQTVPTNSAQFAGHTEAAELAVSRDGRFVYASNRGDNTIVAYSVDRTSGQLTFLQRVTAGGDPWSFSLHPGGRWMLIANEHTNNVAVWRVDPASGRMTDTGVSVSTPAPVCVCFVS